MDQPHIKWQEELLQPDTTAINGRVIVAAARGTTAPTWDRNYDYNVPPPHRGHDYKEEKPINMPLVISWFIGTLLGPSVFDGQYNPHLPLFTQY